MLTQCIRIVIEPCNLHRHRRSPRIKSGQNQSCRIEPGEITYKSTQRSVGITRLFNIYFDRRSNGITQAIACGGSYFSNEALDALVSG